MCIHAWEQVCGVVNVHICGECICVYIIGVPLCLAGVPACRAGMPEVET